MLQFSETNVLPELGLKLVGVWSLFAEQGPFPT